VNHKDVLAVVTADDFNAAAVPYTLSPYTMLRVHPGASPTGLACEPYAVFLEDVLQPVLAAFDDCADALDACEGGAGDAMALFLRQYRAALAEREINSLEAAWAATDRAWMLTKGPLQVNDWQTGKRLQ